jgi:hypothetical protein
MKPMYQWFCGAIAASCLACSAAYDGVSFDGEDYSPCDADEALFESENAELVEEDIGQASQAQRKSPDSGGSCTIEQCNGIKDPFGSYECTTVNNKTTCSCKRGTVSGSCDSEGTNCKEKCSGTTSLPSGGWQVQVAPSSLSYKH